MKDPAWSLLPMEVLCMIFMHVSLHDQLTSLRMVCTRWRDVLAHASFWLDRLRSEGVLIETEMLDVLLSHSDPGEVMCYLQAHCLILDSAKVKEQQDIKMEDTKITEPAVVRSLRKVWDNYEEEEEWVVSDEDLTAATALMIIREPGRLTINLQKAKWCNMDLLLKLAACRSCDVVYLNDYSWKNAYQKTLFCLYDDSPKSPAISVYRGCVHEVEEIPGCCLTDLSLAIAVDERSQGLDPGLQKIKKKFKKIKELYIHIQHFTDISSLCSLPGITDKYGGPGVTLHISGVCQSEVALATHMATVLQPTDGQFRFLTFPHSSLTLDEAYAMVVGLSSASVRPSGGIVVVSPHVPLRDQERELQAHTRQLLNCGIWWFPNDKDFIRYGDNIFNW